MVRKPYQIIKSLKAKVALVAALSLLAPLAIAPAAQALSVNWNPVGAYTINYTCSTVCSGSFDFAMNITQYSQKTGVLSGDGYDLTNSSTTFNLTGSLICSAVTLNVYFPSSGVSVPGTGLVASDGTMAGTASSIYGTYDWHTTSGAVKVGWPRQIFNPKCSQTKPGLLPVVNVFKNFLKNAGAGFQENHWPFGN